MKKISVGILGATGMVGQKFVELLKSHPWFEISFLAASEKSIGRKYGDVVQRSYAAGIEERIAEMHLQPCHPTGSKGLVFSGLDASVAGEIEAEFAAAGYHVVSNAKNHRMSPHVPLLIPEVNSDHLRLLASKPDGHGAIVTNPNCSVTGITLALKPLMDNWGIEAVHVVTLQALSGAGYPGVPSLDISDNVIPYIAGEEAKIESEPLKILGTLQEGAVLPHTMRLSAQCTRVAVADGHLACISVKFKHKPERGALLNAWRQFSALPQHLKLPSAPEHPLIYLDQEASPQPRLHRHLGNGMSVAIGRLRECPLFDWKFVVLSHNTIRGAAGCALLNAELMLKEGYLS